jgi:hypothetical protein
MSNILTVSCPVCGKGIMINRRSLGQPVPCPACKCMVQLPNAGDIAAMEKHSAGDAGKSQSARRFLTISVAGIILGLVTAIIYGLYILAYPYSSKQEKLYEEWIAILVDTPKLLESINDKKSADAADIKLQEYERRLPLLQKEINDMPQRARKALASRYESELRNSRDAYMDICKKLIRGLLNPHASKVFQKHMLMFGERVSGKK